MWKNEIHLSWTSPPQTSFSASSAVLFTILAKGEETGSPSSTLSSSSSSVLLKRGGGRWTKVWLQKASLFEGGMALFFQACFLPVVFLLLLFFCRRCPSCRRRCLLDDEEKFEATPWRRRRRRRWRKGEEGQGSRRSRAVKKYFFCLGRLKSV